MGYTIMGRTPRDVGNGRHLEGRSELFTGTPPKLIRECCISVYENRLQSGLARVNIKRHPFKLRAPRSALEVA